MKICGAQTLIALILCGVSIAHSNHAQILDKQITIRLTDVPFADALKQIEQAANVKFAFSNNQLDDEEPVTVQATQRSLRDILNEVLTPRKIQYKVYEQEKTITLKKYDEVTSNGQSLIPPDESRTRPALPQVTGVVTDSGTKEPMAGVNIIVKGTARGTTSDADGKFTIEADEGEVIVFSFIGYAPTEVKLSGQTHLQVELQEDITSLKEVVVNAGYWTVKKEEQTGNIVKIGNKDIEKQPVLNSLAALQARVPGLEITQQTGVPGGNYKVRIRGQNSITSGSEPLYVIDGVPFISSTLALNETTGEILGAGTNPLNSINPADIESIEVLKDADATAIYGSRGANGVILITTKKGVAGKSKVNLRFYSGFSRVADKISLLNTDQYLMMRREAFSNDGLTPRAANAPDLLLWDTTRYTDWQEVLIGETASTTDAYINYSGGDKETQFLLGAGYHGETTVFPGDYSDERFSAHINLNNTSANGKFKTSVSANYSTILSDLLKQDLTRYALTLAPNAPRLYDNNGNLNWENSTWENPLSYLRRTYEGTTNNLITNLTLSYQILPDLVVKANLGYSNMTMRAITTTPKSSYNPAFVFVDNSTAFSNSRFGNWIIEPQVTWKKNVGKGTLNVLAGTTLLSQKSEALSQTGFGFISESLMKNLQAASSSFVSTNTYADYRYNAVFGRLNYALNGKYILNLTGRRDGSSRFGPGKQFANFGAAGLAWVFSKENLFSRLPFISFGKLRASYGITGNDQISDYGFLDTYSSTGSYMGTPGLSPTRLFNPEFGWETNKKVETAMELGMLQDRLLFNVSYYRNRSSNLLVGYSLPPTTGFTSIQGNLPAIVENTGWEIEFNSMNVERESFRWTTSLNITAPKNQLVDFPDLESSSYANTYVIGEPLTILMAYHYLGIDPSTGLYQFADINQDGTISAPDRQITKYVGRHLYGGIRNQFSFKGFELDIFLQFINQSGYNYLVAGWSTVPGRPGNQPALVMDRWSAEDTNAEIQRFSTTSAAQSAYSRFRSSDRVVDDASFIRFKNISLSYSLPDNLKNKFRLTDGKVFIQGQNLFTITKYEGLDPESQSNVLPPLQTLAAGFNISF